MIWVTVFLVVGLLVLAVFELAEINRLERENERTRKAAEKEMREALVMKETAEANHRYAHHLLRVARDHERQAKDFMKQARGSREGEGS